MKVLVNTNDENEYDDVFGMANLNPEQTGLKVDIWSQHRGEKTGRESHVLDPRVKLTIDNDSISISIERHPKILKPKNCNNADDLRDYFKNDHVQAFMDGIKYIGKNYDLFLKHYTDTDANEYSDYQLMKDLHDRGCFKFC